MEAELPQERAMAQYYKICIISGNICQLYIIIYTGTLILMFATLLSCLARFSGQCPVELSSVAADRQELTNVYNNAQL